MPSMRHTPAFMYSKREEEREMSKAIKNVYDSDAA